MKYRSYVHLIRWEDQETDVGLAHLLELRPQPMWLLLYFLANKAWGIGCQQFTYVVVFSYCK